MRVSLHEYVIDCAGTRITQLPLAAVVRLCFYFIVTGKWPDTGCCFWSVTPLARFADHADVGSPAMALLPAVAQQMRPEETTALALPLLFARSLGQLCGPLLMNADKLQRYGASNTRLLLCLALFLGGYFLLPLLGVNPVTGLGLIFGAHLASNVVFALGTFGVLRHFSAEQVATASAMAWRGQVLIAALAVGCAGLLAESIGATRALYGVSLISLVCVAILLWCYRE
ncbi:MAG: hypothetical protein ACOH2G_02785 [Ewingella sp.]